MTFNVKNGPPSPKKIKLNSENEHKKPVIQNANGTNGVRPKLSIIEQKRKLPIFDKRNKLLDIIKTHDTLIIIGETGCGKTTQIPQYIYSARLQNNGCIAITQPRRVAAISIAKRVALEQGASNELGELVGYTVRFEDVTSKRTKIKYLTDGMLLREAMFDKLLMNYSVIILDEAHERTIHTDVLFGVVKKIQKQRKLRNLAPLKLLIMSATMDVDHFSQYFNNCQAVYIEGRTFPVNIFYTLKPYEDYLAASVATFFKIHREAPPNHDVLIFLTGQEEIEAVAHQIRVLSKDEDVTGPPIRVHTLYAAQPSAAQMTVFQPTPEGTRKVIISTNIAETSITISGVKYVIDCGMVKVRTYQPTTGLEMLKVQRISQEQAWQRAGRAGRDSEGYCYRLYTRSQFDLMPRVSVPEIQRANLNSVALQLLTMGVHAQHFDFMNKPPQTAVDAAFYQLKLLGAIEETNSTKLTELGSKLAKFPLDPRYSKILMAADKFGCLAEALTVVSFMSGESVLLNPPSKKEQARSVRQKFNSAHGDLIMLLNIYREYSQLGEKNARSWCHDHLIHVRNMAYVTEIRSQLEEICKNCSISKSSCTDRTDNLRKALIAGLFMNVAELSKDRQYLTLHKRQTASIHPSSVLHGQQPHILLFSDVVQTTRSYIKGLTVIEPEWLNEVVPDYIKIANIKLLT